MKNIVKTGLVLLYTINGKDETNSLLTSARGGITMNR